MGCVSPRNILESLVPEMVHSGAFLYAILGLNLERLNIGVGRGVKIEMGAHTSPTLTNADTLSRQSQTVHVNLSQQKPTKFRGHRYSSAGAVLSGEKACPH